MLLKTEWSWLAYSSYPYQKSHPDILVNRGIIMKSPIIMIEMNNAKLEMGIGTSSAPRQNKLLLFASECQVPSKYIKGVNPLSIGLK